MYTKTGLSALAIAGVTFGAIGLLTGAGSASPADCRAPSTSVAAPAAGGGNGSSSGSATNPAAKTPAKTVTNRAKNKTAGGTSGGKGSNLVDVNTRPNGPSNGGANVTVPADGTAPSAGTTPSGSADQPFLDLQGNSQPVGSTSGAPTVPSSGAHVVGRSSSLGGLIHVTGRANSGR
jgi:hypothetical protein